MNATPSINGDSVRTAWRPRTATADEFNIEQGEDGGQVISYTVQRGDTLSHIARALGTHHDIEVSYQTIASQNDIPNPNLIEVGQQLTITVGQAATPAQPQPAPQPSEVAQPAEPAEAEADDYLVESDEYGYCSAIEETTLADPYEVALFGDMVPSSTISRPPIVNGVMADPSLINQTEARESLLLEADVAIQAGNETLALEIADLFINNCTDEEGARAGANIYLNIADQLFEAGSYTRASAIYRQLASRFSDNDQTLSLYPSDQTNETTNGITILSAQDGEEQVYFDGAAYLNVLDVSISRTAIARAEQCEFLTRSGVEDPFDLGQVRTYMLSLSADEIGAELEAYLSSFYFHIGSDVPDGTTLSDTASYPLNIIGQRPIDCRVFTQLTRHILTPGLLTRGWNYVTGASSPYQFHDVFTTQINPNTGIRNPNAGHQMLLIETSSGALLLNNDQIIALDDGEEATIAAYLVEFMDDLHSDPGNPPMTHLRISDDGELPDPSDWGSAHRISSSGPVFVDDSAPGAGPDSHAAPLFNDS